MSERSFEPWSEAEDEHLRKHWGDPRRTGAQIAAEIGRTERAAFARARLMLGLVKAPAKRSGAWTDERKEQCLKLWKDGLSASQISQRLGGATRNAVIGVVHRSGLVSRGAPSRPKRVAAAVPPKPPKQPTPPKAPPKLKIIADRQVFVEAERPPPKVEVGDRAFVPLDGCEPVPFGSRGCKWPVSLVAGASMLQCGCERDGESPYCPTHRAAATVPTSKPRQLARSLRRYA